MIYRALFRLILQRVDPERAHAFASLALRRVSAIGLVRDVLVRTLARPDPTLRVRALGLDFPSPLGVAAGVDKDAAWIEGLAALGFGFVEVGTVTAKAQPGNPRPRVFRLMGDRALVNRMGFPNTGAPEVAARLKGRAVRPVVGVNIGKTKSAALDDAGADYRESARLLAPLADYLVLNVSSPNTPGLRDIQGASERLASLVSEVLEELDTRARHVPLLVKIAPDLTDAEVDALADQAVALGLDGIVAVNTTTSRDRLGAEAGSAGAAEAGGLSGPPLKARGLEIIERLHARAGDRLVLISVGGIETPEDAWERLAAGATLVQAYTAFVYGGPLWASRMNRGLAKLMRRSATRSPAARRGHAPPAPSAPPTPPAGRVP